MSTTSRLKVLYLSHFSKPASDRPIYRLVCRKRVRSIVELGVGLGERAVRLIQAAARYTPVEDVRYTGIDLFDMRTSADGWGLTLKAAHRLLKPTGARIQLVPGDLFNGLSRAANGLAGTDLVIVSAGYDPDCLARAWYYVPRMLAEESRVLVEQEQGPEGEMVVRTVDPARIDALAAKSQDRFRRAA